MLIVGRWPSPKAFSITNPAPRTSQPGEKTLNFDYKSVRWRTTKSLEQIGIMPQNPSHKFAIAPMMDWTDTHCRVLNRLLTRRALLYTEMVTADAVLRGDRIRLLGFDPSEQPVALQLGGSDPVALAQATR